MFPHVTPPHGFRCWHNQPAKNGTHWCDLADQPGSDKVWVLRATAYAGAWKLWSHLQWDGCVFSLPTGSRKSLCYCILPIIFNLLRCTVGLSIAVVVSPLVALMKEQVSAMESRGLTAVYVRDCDDEGAATNVCRGSFQLVYMTLESMLNDICWRDMLLSPVYQENLVALVVDKPTA